MTKTLKDLILSALDKAGGEAYLVEQAHKNPGPFMSLVAKVLPLQMTSEAGGALIIRWERAEPEPDKVSDAG
jgi:hypothetical protein